MAIKFDGLDKAIIGLIRDINNEIVLIYSYDKIVEIFMEEGMTMEEAIEFVDYNIIGFRLSNGTPIIMGYDEEDRLVQL